MGSFLVRRATRALVVLVLVSVAVFGMSLLTGDPIKLLIPAEATPEQLEQLRQAHGLDDPAPLRLVRFLAGAVQGDFGYSFRFRQPAVAVVTARLGATVELAVAAMVVTLLVALPAGVVAALRRGTATDTLVVAGSVVGHSVPTFVVGLLAIYLLAVQLGLLPTSGRGTVGHVIMPAVTLGLFYAGRAARLVRASMLDVLDQEYMRTARAKGLTEWVVVARHGLKNAGLPVLTILGLELGALLGGAVVTETVFAWPGVGRLAVEAALARDYPVVQAVVVLVAAFFVAVNLVVDMLYTCLDPRVRLG